MVNVQDSEDNKQEELNKKKMNFVSDAQIW